MIKGPVDFEDSYLKPTCTGKQLQHAFFQNFEDGSNNI